MKIPFDKLFMLLFDLDNAIRVKRTFSEEENCYVVDTEDLQEPLTALVKLISDKEN